MNGVRDMTEPDNRQKILIVDDTPENIRILVELLKDEFATIVATGGERALRLAVKEPLPDMILLDVMMPEMDGYEVCSRLKSDSRTADIPVIFITALQDKKSEQLGLGKGAVDFISKPFIPELVLLRVRIHLELQRHRRHLEELVSQRTRELEELNRHLDARVTEEVEKNREKDQYLAHQARFASMGQMMSAISHQWRQPLNNIGLLLQNASIDFHEGRLDINTFDKTVSDAMKSLKFLSTTIDLFRNFFKGKASSTVFTLQETISRTCALLRAELESHSINVEIENLSSPLLRGNDNELSHALLNILVNSMEALVERCPESPLIRIVCDSSEGFARVTISDNAGGIPEEIIGSIFDPYFTTKFMSQGTGIGLYLTRMIVEKQLGGRVTACNGPDGAILTVELPEEPLRGDSEESVWKTPVTGN